MVIFLKLLLAHILGDFLMQPRAWVAHKEKNKATSPYLYLHIVIHGGLVMLFLWDWSLFTIALLIAGSHLVIDLIKIYIQKPHTRTTWFGIDQLLHVAVLIAVYIWQTGDYFGIENIPNNYSFWLVLTGVIFLTSGVSIIMNVMLQRWSKFVFDATDNSLSNAGKYIGILERMFVFVFILTDHWEAVGFLITAKSVFRFGDLKESRDRKLTEYILIGTLLSFGFAIFTALLTKHLLALNI